MITSESIANLLAGMGISLGAMNIMDSAYSCVDDAFIGKFAGQFADAMFRLGLTYRPEQFDCDDYAWLAWALIRASHAASGKRETGVAVAVAIYTPELTFERHARVMFIVKRDGEHKAVWWEPQGTKTVEMTPDEIESISLLVM